jgi:predicted ATPase/DNA-binding CsgD family transcriptional regulator
MTSLAAGGGENGRRIVDLANYQDFGPSRSQLLLQRSLQAAPLIGRQDDLAVLTELLDDPSIRLVTVAGRSGVGKTRLALEVGWARDVVHPGSVCMVSLANLQEPDLALAEIAAQLEVPTLPAQSLAAAVIRWLDRSPLLLIIDNFEHILGIAHRMTGLLDACQQLKLLVTSQAPLHLRPERVLRLGPLPVPPAGSVDPSTIIDQPAVALYCDRARAVDYRFSLNADNTSTVVELCRQLEGLPLAIELAAARAPTMPAAAVLTRLAGGRLDVLRSPRPDAPARHQDLRAAIAWTFDLLSPAEQDLLRRLSVVGAPFEVDDAEALAGDQFGHVLDGLSTLVDLHLVESMPMRDLSNFDLPPSIRDFGREELTAIGDLAAIEGAWTFWLAGRARSAAKGLHYSDPDAWWDWLDRAYDQLLHALQVCLAGQRPAEALDLLGALAPQWVNRALESAHRQLLERTIEMAERQEHHTGALAEAWTWSAQLGLERLTPDRPDLLVDRLGRAEALARSLADDDRLLHILEVNAFVAWRSTWARGNPMDQLERIKATFAEGLELARRTGATGWLARFEVHWGQALASEGDEDGSLIAVLSGLDHARQANDTAAILDAASMLQTMATRSPEAAAALPPPQQLLEMAYRTHQPAIAAVLLPTLAVQAAAAGDLADAAQRCRQGLRLSGLDPSSFLTGMAAFAAVEIAAANGDREVAARLHGRLLDSEQPLYAVIPPPFVTAHQTVISGLRDSLGADSFATFTAEGARRPWPSILRELDDYLEGVAVRQPPAPAAPVSPATGRDQRRRHGLTDRQEDVVRLLANGYSNKEIAQALGVTPKTAMHHTAAIYQKLGVRGRSETVAWAIRTGIAPLPA